MMNTCIPMTHLRNKIFLIKVKPLILHSFLVLSSPFPASRILTIMNLMFFIPMLLDFQCMFVPPEQYILIVLFCILSLYLEIM